MSWKVAPISLLVCLIACGQLINLNPEEEVIECESVERIRTGVGLVLTQTSADTSQIDAFSTAQPECLQQAVLEYDGIGVLRQFEDRAVILDQTPDAATVQFIERDLSLGNKLTIDSDCMPVDALPFSNGRMLISCHAVPHILVWNVEDNTLDTVIDLITMTTGGISLSDGDKAWPGMDQMAMDDEYIYVTIQDLVYNHDMDKTYPIGPGRIAKISQNWLEVVISLEQQPGFPLDPFWRPKTRMAQLSTGEFVIGCAGNGMGGGPESDPTIGVVKLNPSDISKYSEIVADSNTLMGVPKDVVVTKDDRIFVWVGAPAPEDMLIVEEEGIAPPPGFEMHPPMPSSIVEVVEHVFPEGEIPEENHIGMALPFMDYPAGQISALEADPYGRLFVGFVPFVGAGRLGYMDVTKDDSEMMEVVLSGAPKSIILY